MKRYVEPAFIICNVFLIASAVVHMFTGWQLASLGAGVSALACLLILIFAGMGLE